MAVPASLNARQSATSPPTVLLYRKRLTRRRKCYNNHTFSYRKKQRDSMPHGRGGLRGPSGRASRKTARLRQITTQTMNYFVYFRIPSFHDFPGKTHPRYNTTTPYSPIYILTIFRIPNHLACVTSALSASIFVFPCTIRGFYTLPFIGFISHLLLHLSLRYTTGFGLLGLC